MAEIDFQPKDAQTAAPSELIQPTLELLGGALRMLGENVEDSFLMGLSGWAFRLLWGTEQDAGRLCEGAAGFDAPEAVLEALGYRIPSDAPELSSLREGILNKRALQRGALKGGLMYLPEWGHFLLRSNELGCLLGKEEEENLLDAYEGELCHYLVLLMGEPCGHLGLSACIEKSICLAVESMSLPRSMGFWSGLAAYRQWCVDLVEDAGVGKADTQACWRDAFRNWWVYQHLVRARMAATDYLKFLREEAVLREKSLLSGACILFQDVSDILQEGEKLVWDPWRIQREGEWPFSLREHQSQLLKEAAFMEREALDQLQKILFIRA